MIRGMSAVLLATLATPTAAARAEGPIVVPSGQEVVWIETISDAQGPMGLTIRFRFLAPAIAAEGGTVTPEAALEDMAYLCDTFALPRLSEMGPQPAEIVISMADRPLPFGVAEPEATQYFEAYRPEAGACIWEAY